jgi:hypothetical protein
MVSVKGLYVRLALPGVPQLYFDVVRCCRPFSLGSASVSSCSRYQRAFVSDGRSTMLDTVGLASSIAFGEAGTVEPRHKWRLHKQVRERCFCFGFC